jgi:transposase
VRLVTERGAEVVKAAGALKVAEIVLLSWKRRLSGAPASAFLGDGDIRGKQAGIMAPENEVARKAVCDTPRKRGAHFAKDPE